MNLLINTIRLSICCVLLVSCNESVKEEGTTSFSEKKEVSDSLKEVVNEKKSDPQTIKFEDQSTDKYTVSLPNSWKIEAMNEESLDYCNYEARLPDGTKILELNALLNTRFDTDNIQDLYNASLSKTELKVTYKLQKDNWFVISGVDKVTKNIVYCKRVLGEQFVSDLRFDYPKSKEAEVGPSIGRIAKSFDSE
jgi:hypothetical protein